MATRQLTTPMIRPAVMPTWLPDSAPMIDRIKELEAHEKLYGKDIFENQQRRQALRDELNKKMGRDEINVVAAQNEVTEAKQKEQNIYSFLNDFKLIAILALAFGIVFMMKK